MTHADKLIDRWINDRMKCPSISAWAKEVDPKARVQTYLYTGRVDIVFSDGSKATLSKGSLSRGNK